jgi:CDP-L-myo-inositol myo-inositolphosphotransferase
MLAVVLAAGTGSRMGLTAKATPKGLLKVAGREILYRTLHQLRECGVDSFIIVTNRRFAPAYRDFCRRNRFKCQVIENPHPEKGNGYSLYLAKPYITARFVVVMSDHVYEDAFVKRAVNGTGLIFDRLGVYIRKGEATKVKVEAGRVTAVGKNLPAYDGFDTGFFVLDREVLDVAEELLKTREKLELSELVETAGVPSTQLSGYFWMDVDTPQDLRDAHRHIVELSVKSGEDGFVSRVLNRKISTRITRLLVNRVSPAWATLASFLTGLLSALTLPVSIPLGGFVYQLSSVLDGVDGEMARASMRVSKLGGYIDSILDRYIDFLFLTTLAFVGGITGFWWLFVCMALFGSLMVSYSAERYRSAFCDSVYTKLRLLRLVPGKRDERIFLTMLFCILLKVKLLFVVLAVLANLKALLTVAVVFTETKWRGWSHA